jgi:hypothetical protein
MMVCSILFLYASIVTAQCVPEVKDVLQDPARGSIIVETEYKVNGEVVQLGRTRYLETSGSEAEIIQKAKDDGQIHCVNLIKRIPNNSNYLKSEKLKRQKELTADLVTSIKSKLVGFKGESITEATDTFKGKNIKVTHDENNSVTDTP